jgi:hypothetical protein
MSKTLHPMLPELVADLDPAMMAWARKAWFGLEDPADAEDPELWIEVAELLEDVLVLRAQPLGQIARRLRRSAPGIAPVSRLGPVLAAFWDAYWTTMSVPATAALVRVDADAAGAAAGPQTEPAAATPPARTTRPRTRAKRASSGAPRPRAPRKTGGGTSSNRPRTPRPNPAE